MVVGTHTHVPTNDARILHKGTAYQTDAGMCGDYDSVIGMNKEPMYVKKAKIGIFGIENAMVTFDVLFKKT